jgi:hypothetical protein
VLLELFVLSECFKHHAFKSFDAMREQHSKTLESCVVYAYGDALHSEW